MDYKKAWEEQKEFMKSSMRWMDAVMNNSDTNEEKLQTFGKKEALKLIVERMESIENSCR